MLNNDNNIAGPISKQTNGSRSVFARIMSTENITVLFDPKSKDAWFDTNSRTLNMPNWTGMTPEVYDLLLSHEVSHALHTPKDGWISLTDELVGKGAGEADRQVARQYINIVEDARIERMIKAKYPGLARDYYKGYDWLVKSGFMGKIDTNNLGSMEFIDRINIHFKAGIHSGVSVPFSPEEQTIVDMIADAESFEDVAKVSRLVWDHATTGNDPKKSEAKSKNGEAGEGEGNEEGDGEPTEGEGDENGKDKDGQGNAPSDKQRRIAPKPKTFDAQEKFLRDHKDKLKPWERANPDNPGIMPTLDLSRVIVPSKTIYSQIDDALAACTRCGPWITHAKSDFSDFVSEANPTVDAMVKTFMLKKAATAHHRQQEGKTGTLDMNKLSTYKWNDDLFKHFTIKPNGKNHGFILYLDWSGSMGGLVMNVVKQMYTLTSFFRRIGVPFDVYAFSSHQPSKKFYSDWYEYRRDMNDEQYEKEMKEMQRDISVNPKPGEMEVHPFFLYHFASSSMSSKDHKAAMEKLYMLAQTMVTAEWNKDMKMNTPQFPYWLSLSDTPLDQTLVAANQMVEEFQRKHRIEIMNVVVITDGASSGSPCYNHSRLVNPKTNASFPVDYNATNTLAEYLHDNTGCNTMMLYLDTAQSASNIHIPGYVVAGPNGKVEPSMKASDEACKMWTSENFVTAVPQTMTSEGWKVGGQGFKQVFAIRIPRKAADDSFEGMDIDNTNYSRLKSQFVKSLRTRIVSRSLVNRMVEAMAKHT